VLADSANVSVPADQRLHFTPSCKQVLEKAENIAKEAKSREIGTDHAMIALLSADGVVKRIFECLKVDRGEVQQHLRRVLPS
jgi:ATP-dependent Clp protease ATP-binding subunit ClpA